jgi:hypothetical protein
LTAGKPEGQILLDNMARSMIGRQDYRHCMLIIRAFCMLATSDPNGVLLISERTVLVPCLVKVLHRESSQIWGIADDNKPIKE